MCAKKGERDGPADDRDDALRCAEQQREGDELPEMAKTDDEPLEPEPVKL